MTLKAATSQKRLNRSMEFEPFLVECLPLKCHESAIWWFFSLFFQNVFGRSWELIKQIWKSALKACVITKKQIFGLPTDSLQLLYMACFGRSWELIKQISKAALKTCVITALWTRISDQTNKQTNIWYPTDSLFNYSIWLALEGLENWSNKSQWQPWRPAL